jgi:hypothetical protein
MTTLKVEINQEEDLPILKALLNRMGLNFTVSENDWDRNLSQDEIEGIEAGLNDYREGRVHSHQDVLEIVKQKLDNFKNKNEE